MNHRTARRGAAVASLALVGAVGAGTVGATTVPAGDGEPLRLGILAECEGAFGGFNEDTVAGVTLAMVNFAGATSNSTTTALDGFTGAVAGGRPIEVVGVGCGDDTADRIIQEVRTLVEQNNAEIVVGPLSGDEAIAVANYAKDHPEVTFIDGIAGSQEPTLQVQAENYFRFHGDGAQWNAGLGDRLYNEAGWRTAAVIADDYSFGWTSAAGFIADFCAVGGDVVTRVFPPLGTTDYSSFIQQLPDPDEVDGYFWVVGGTGTNAALEAFVNAKGDLTGDQHAGNLFFSPALASALGPDIAGAYIGGFAAFPPDVLTPAIEEYKASADATWESLRRGAAGGETGRAVDGCRLRLHVRLLRRRPGDGPGARCRRWRLVRRPRRVPRGAVDDDAGGTVRQRDARREPAGHHRHVRRPTRSRRGVRRSGPADRGDHPAGRPDLRRHVRPRYPATVAGRPAVRGARAAVDRQRDPGRRRCSADRRGHRRQRSGWHGAGWHGAGRHGAGWVPSRWPPNPQPRRPPQADERHDGDRVAAEGIAPFVQLRDVVVRFGGLLALGGVNLDVARGERLAVLGPNGAGKTTLFNVIAGDLHPTSGTIVINGVDCTTAPSRQRPKLGVARTYQKTRLFPGLTVEDNLQLAWIGKHGESPSLSPSGLRGAGRDAARAAARRCGWLTNSTPSSATCRTDNSASSRWAWSSSPSQS